MTRVTPNTHEPSTGGLVDEGSTPMRLPALRRPSPSMAVSVLALVVASTGTSYAAGLIGSADIRNDSVSSVDIKDRTIKGKDVRTGAIGAKQVKDGSLRSRDFKPGQLPAGPQGPAGPAGTGRWALVDATGAIVSQSGGFTVAAGYPDAPAAANGNVYINAGENLANNAVLATIALQNTVDQNGDMVMNGRALGADNNPEFSGEVTVAVCTPGVVNCAPAGTGNPNHLVVSPRNSDGSVTTGSDRKRFYVVVTGDSSDRG